MSLSPRTILIGLVLVLVAACTSSATSPGDSSPSATPDATLTASPGVAATDTESTTPEAAPTPTPAASRAPSPVIATLPGLTHGEYLLVRKSISLPNDQFRAELWLTRPNGTGSRKIAEGYTTGVLSPPAYNLDGVWSHDGSVVHVMTGCDSQLSDVPVTGGAAVATASMTNKDAGFVWSPDDSKIAYWHFTGGDVICAQNGLTMARDLMVMNADGTGKTVVRQNIPWGTFTLQSWINSNYLLARYENDWVKIAVADGTLTHLNLPADAPTAKVSPDQKRIAYHRSNGHIYVRATNGGVAVDRGTGTYFEWSPDSKLLAIGGVSLKVAGALTSDVTNIYNFSSEKLTWSPDSKYIAIRKTAGGGIFYIAAAGGPANYVPDTMTCYDVKWQP
jgi:hypothetical protein